VARYDLYHPNRVIPSPSHLGIDSTFSNARNVFACKHCFQTAKMTQDPQGCHDLTAESFLLHVSSARRGNMSVCLSVCHLVAIISTRRFLPSRGFHRTIASVVQT